MAGTFTKTLALYQAVGLVDYVFVSEYFGADDVSHHPKDTVRISEPVEVNFQPLSTAESLERARAALDAEEARLRADTEMRLRSLQQKREALTSSSTEAA